MRIVFASNFINHHQLPFCEELLRLCAKEGGTFTFLQMEEMDEERKGMGWEDFPVPAYVQRYAFDAAGMTTLAEEADILLIGGDGLSEVIENRLRRNRPVVRISERIYREGQWKRFSPRGLLAKYRSYIRFADRPYYLLCAGAYVASDFSLIHAFPDKMYRFGYFPQTRRYTEEECRRRFQGSEETPVRLLFAARFLSLKRPEYPIRLAAELAAEKIPFRLYMIGDDSAGDKDFQAESGYRRRLEEEVQKAGLSESVTFHGMLSPKEVRDRMEETDVFLFPSDHLEGWGAVVTEAMNSGCAVVASREAGVTPFLIRDNENGISFDGSYADFAAKTKELLKDKGRIQALGQRAMETILTDWNAQTAAERFYGFCEAVLQGKEYAAPEDGPMSKATIIKPLS
ncbi:MAG: glycosyltransferase family 4 protein [Lachnospiraceae bacterium]|nr:glycosyltransferase family 4 protein [Lachnospiraceae bacterium]